MLITDVYPFVGHLSVLGRQHLRVDGERMIARACEVRALRPCLIVAGGEAARWSIARAFQAPPKDLTESLGIPGCLWNNTLVIAIPHPSIAQLESMKGPFTRRGHIIRAVLTGASLTTGEEPSYAAPLLTRKKQAKPQGTPAQTRLKDIIDWLGWKEESFRAPSPRSCPP